MEPSGDPQPPNDQAETLDVADLQSREPFGLFRQWVQEAEKVQDPLEAHVMTLATANKEGVPSARSMSVKKLDNRGLILFTCYDGRKAKELEENPHCSVVFYWVPLNKSVRIDGTVEPAPEESEAVFSELPRGLQIVTHVGTQSAVIPNKEDSMKRKQELMLEFSDESKPVPKPDNWGCYRVVPAVFEFWCGHSHWLCDRLRFRRPREGEVINKSLTMEMEDGWLLERLSH